MASRRNFLKGLSGATAGMWMGSGFVDSALAMMQQPATPRPKRREVSVGGRRVTTVDVHAHIQFPDFWKVVPKDYPLPDYVQPAAQAYRAQPTTFDPSGPVVNQLLRDMDEMGLDMRAISMNPPPYWVVEPELARQVIRVQNEKLAELVAARPDRFVGLGNLALHHPVLAVEQMEEGITKLGLRGFMMGGSVNGEELSSTKFHQVWAKADQLGAVFFIHPWGFNGNYDLRPGQPRFGGNGQLGNVIGNPLETTIALSHLIQEGTLDLFPNLKIIAAHGGGFLPSYAGRSDQCQVQFPDGCKPLKKKPSEYLKQLYYDSMLFTAEGLRHLIAEVGVSQVMIGTDGNRWNHEAVDRVLAVPGLSQADQIAILGGSAAKLLRIRPS